MGGVLDQRAIVLIHASADGTDCAGRVSDDDRRDDGFLSFVAWRQDDHRTDAVAAELDPKPDLQRGLVAFSHDFDNRLVTYLCWYLLTSVGMVVCRSLIRFGAGWLRNRGLQPPLCRRCRRSAGGPVLLDKLPQRAVVRF